MTAKTYAITSALIFALVAAVHLLRLVLQWDVIIAGHSVPAWMSIVAILVSGLLSVAGFRVAQQIQRYLT